MTGGRQILVNKILSEAYDGSDWVDRAIAAILFFQGIVILSFMGLAPTLHRRVLSISNFHFPFVSSEWPGRLSLAIRPCRVSYRLDSHKLAHDCVLAYRSRYERTRGNPGQVE
jgi:hypothetical protein